VSCVILLNGVGSVGKSSLARALQAVARDVYLHVQMDAFLGMLPERTFGTSEGFTFETETVAGHPVTTVRSGPAARRAMTGMRRAIAALADAGNHLIVDDVMLNDEDGDYAALLARHRLIVIGLTAPLAALEERERVRGDRLAGLARAQVERVHAGRRYDLMLDTAAGSPDALAARICAAFDL
jgi:chloramphenicol 3-O phosphotransferase